MPRHGVSEHDQTHLVHGHLLVEAHVRAVHIHQDVPDHLHRHLSMFNPHKHKKKKYRQTDLRQGRQTHVHPVWIKHVMFNRDKICRYLPLRLAFVPTISQGNIHSPKPKPPSHPSLSHPSSPLLTRLCLSETVPYIGL